MPNSDSETAHTKPEPCRSATRRDVHPGLRTTNTIESTFATVRHRTKITRSPGSRAAGLGMASKLIQAARTDGGWSTRPTWSESSAPTPDKLVERPDNG